jgi:hypothetical protein
MLDPHVLLFYVHAFLGYPHMVEWCPWFAFLPRCIGPVIFQMSWRTRSSRLVCNCVLVVLRGRTRPEERLLVSGSLFLFVMKRLFVYKSCSILTCALSLLFRPDGMRCFQGRCWQALVCEQNVTTGAERRTAARMPDVIFFTAATSSCNDNAPTSPWVESQCESVSYVRTDGQSVSLSWIKAPIWGLRPDIYY